MNAETCIHRILIRGDVAEAKQLIEQHLGVEVWEGGRDPVYGTALDFTAPHDVNVDFLRPKFLPPVKA